MIQIALLFFSCILAGFALTSVPSAWIIGGSFLFFFKVVGVIAILLFSLALIFLGLKTLFKKDWY